MRLAGAWHGWSIYVPIDGFFFQDRETIYRTDAVFSQRRSSVEMDEDLTHIYDVNGKHLDHVPARHFTGSGTVTSDTDVRIDFRDNSSNINGSMYLYLDRRADELYGILAVRPRPLSRPVAVKLVLRRAEQPLPSLQDLGLQRIKALVRDLPDLSTT